MQKFNYVFSEIPNDEEGRKFIKQMRKYYNSKSYTMRVKGQYLNAWNRGWLQPVDSEKANGGWKKFQRGQPISKSKCLRVYFYLKKHIIWRNIT